MSPQLRKETQLHFERHNCIGRWDTSGRPDSGLLATLLHIVLLDQLTSTELHPSNMLSTSHSTSFWFFLETMMQISQLHPRSTGGTSSPTGSLQLSWPTSVVGWTSWDDQRCTDHEYNQIQPSVERKSHLRTSKHHILIKPWSIWSTWIWIRWRNSSYFYSEWIPRVPVD